MARAPPIYSNRFEISSRFLSGLSFESYSGGEQLFGYLQSGKKPQGICLFSLTSAGSITLGKQLLFLFCLVNLVQLKRDGEDSGNETSCRRRRGWATLPAKGGTRWLLQLSSKSSVTPPVRFCG